MKRWVPAYRIRKLNVKILPGLTASPGICSGRAYIFKAPDLSYDPSKMESLEEEKQRLTGAFGLAFAELDRIKDTLSGSLGEEYGHIFRAQMTILEDDDFKQEILDKLEENPCRAETAVEEIYKMYEGLFSEIEDNAYNAQRLADLNDVCKRVLRNLLGRDEVTLSALPPESIVVAEELFPSDTAMMDRKHIRGFVTERGGLTSHVAILAKSLSIPAAVGTPGVTGQTEKGDAVILDVRDFEKALVYINPDAAAGKKLENDEKEYRERQEALFKMKDLESVTRDGVKITLSANIGSVEDLAAAQGFGAKSVGLFRTEFLFLKGELPDEEEQYQVYAGAAKKLAGGMLVIRTLDIGGDKEVKALNLPKEENPFLGLRGIRLCLKYEDLFLTQLRALLRAAVYGDIRIMFPMVSSVVEFRRARELAARAAAELKERGVEYRSDPPLGVMVETPAAVFLADELTREAAFVSMGTNDLTQYVLSVDRGNEEISSYYRTFSPAVLRAVSMTAEAAGKNGKWTGVCGELGSNPMAIPVLIGLGVEELSVTGSAIPRTIALIRSLDSRRCREIAEKAISLATEDEVKGYLKVSLAEETPGT
ncbi:MAG: phosphoenolpyruvate--protein phosphotransferase [Treponema sp.]|jgi:phosphotransferase system enzyme I (PtsI)|nr:phosphoenolpyruvate--protein phosphotransferase [Treponema sp.]